MSDDEHPTRQEDLISQKEWLRVTLSSIGDGVIATDADGRITFINPVAEKLTGWIESEALGKPLDEVFQIISEETRQPAENPAQKALREGVVVGLANHTLLIRKNGGEISIADSSAPIRNGKNQIVGVVLVFRDVSERRRAEIELREAKEFAENIVDTVQHPLLVLDGDLRVQTASRSFYKTFQVSPRETENQFLYDLGNGQWNLPKLRTLLSEVLNENAPLEGYEMAHRFPSIGYRYMRLNARRLFREGTHSQLILLAIEDVTEETKARRERQEIETRFTSLVKNIRDHSIFTLDPTGYITSWNLEAENILGYSEKEVLGQHFSIIFTPEDREKGIPQKELDTARAVGRAEDERWHRRKNGELFWALGIVTPTRDSEGNHSGYSKILRDMTDRKRSQETLVNQSEQLRMLWDSASALLTATDPKKMLKEMFSRISGHLDVDAYFNFVVDESGDSLRLVSCAGVPDKTVRAMERLQFGQAVCGTVALEKQPLVATYVQQSSDPKTELVRGLGIRAYACNPLIFEERLIGTLSFASRARDTFTEEELAFFQTIAQYVTVTYVRLRLVEELQLAHHRKDEFLAMLAHELRNPLAPIRSGLDLLAMEDREHQETIQLMQTQMSHVVRLVDDLMDVSRIMRGKVELRRGAVELDALIQQSVAAARPSIDRQNQELVIDLPEEGLVIDGDMVRLVQVLENLLNNASKYTDAGGRIELTAERQGEMASITVRDNGVGISPDLLPVVFDLFTQSTRTLDRAQGGLGIGLTLVKSLVELHGGTISVESEGLGRGSCFTVQLPLTEATVEAQEKNESFEAAARWRILAVDDHVGAAQMLGKLLQQLGGHQVETAHDGPSVLTKVAKACPDLIFLDIGLPGMDGFEVARQLRQNPEYDDVLLVALTGYGKAEDHQKSQEAGFDEHLVKPPSVDQLREILVHPKLKNTPRRSAVASAPSGTPSQNLSDGQSDDGQSHRQQPIDG